MKWIKSRKRFLIKEAKLRDVIMDKQKNAVKNKWAEKYLDYEEIDATENIKQGKWNFIDGNSRR